MHSRKSLVKIERSADAKRCPLSGGTNVRSTADISPTFPEHLRGVGARPRHVNVLGAEVALRQRTRVGYDERNLFLIWVDVDPRYARDFSSLRAHQSSLELM